MPMPEIPRIVLFCHSLISDWNHGNAHFLRGIARELVARGFDLRVYEPADAWSAANLRADEGEAALSRWRDAYPTLRARRYDLAALDLDEALEGAALVLVHEWNDPVLVARIGRHRREGGRYLLLFHDTHHRAVSDPEAIARLPLDDFDGVLAFGEVLREAYLRLGWTHRAFTWHEAADIAHFMPPAVRCPSRDLIWVGNWGDGERTAEIAEFLLEPVRTLGLDARVHGVRYPAEARAALRAAGIAFGGYLPNHEVPAAFAHSRVTVHIPRRPYARLLPGIPTIRVFEALACGIPLVSAPWEDAEGLFSPGDDYLVARSGEEMRHHLRAVLAETALAKALAAHGLDTVRRRHSCAHRIDELLAICSLLDRDLAPAAAKEPAPAQLMEA